MLNKEPKGERMGGWNTPFIEPNHGVIINNRYWVYRVRRATPNTESTAVRIFDIETGTLSGRRVLHLDTFYNLSPELPNARLAITRYGKTEVTTRMHVKAPREVPLTKEENYVIEYKKDVFEI